jgi:hypothetical protein
MRQEKDFIAAAALQYLLQSARLKGVNSLIYPPDFSLQCGEKVTAPR